MHPIYVVEVHGTRSCIRLRYGRHEPELRPIERILRGELGEEVTLRWLTGEMWREGAEVEVKEWPTELEGRSHSGEVVGFTDGSRMEGRAAGASAERGLYLGEFATVMDAEMIGIAGAWEEAYRVVASDSQAAIRSCSNLTSGAQAGRSWIDERVLKAAKDGPRKVLMWVKGHSGVEGNELSEGRGEQGTMDVGTQPSHTGGNQTSVSPIRATPTPQVESGRAQRPNVPTHGQGPDGAWLDQIGVVEDGRCGCGECRTQHISWLQDASEGR